MLLFLMGTIFSVVNEDCLPKEALNDKIILEKYCTEGFKSECTCEIGNEIKCGFKPTEELVITFGDETTIEFMKFKTSTHIATDNPMIIEYLCSSIIGYPCSCYKEGNEVRCTSEWAEFYVNENEDGVTLELSEYWTFVPYCEESIIEEEEEFTTNIEKNEEDKYEITIENAPKTLHIVALSLNFNENASITPSETTEEDIQKLEEILQEEFEGYETEIIESVRVDLKNIKDGEDIEKATIKFEIPKSKLSGDIVVVRIDDNGNFTIIEPEIIDAGDYYIILVYTDGLSLYAVATVNQISTSSPIEEEIQESAHLCGGVAGLILLSLGFYYIKN